MQPPMQMQPSSGQPMPAMNNTMVGHGLGTPPMSPMNPPMVPGMMGAPAQGGMNPQLHQVRIGLGLSGNRTLSDAQRQDGRPLPNGRIDSSPQNAAVGIGGQPPRGPGGPRPAGAPTTAPLTPPASARTAPSTSVNLNGSTPNMANHPPPPVPATNGLDATSFGIDFSAGLDFDPGMFNGESLNFERDFAAWFDPENA